MPSCKKLFDDLVVCLSASDCVLVEKNRVKECLDKKHDESVPKECRLLQESYFACKRSVVDPRRRFRGPLGGRPEDSNSNDDNQ
ncbi:hypothetical protein SmJEL517_g02372 [Synchytrium microbalum]|uniref:Cytochrome c oxidase assembly factor 5 n=1 Tax=Synchytrium microbalum TaxID=1806994 RepID=A0A507C5Z7_9FUNG|nr:uncharacterized protein SmJEL517_g02372 [Synchytrium microbalum]TPX35062.1 hypothetical protein SmJEL517_g02372 [Synchytrium microbalum]